MSWEKEPQFFSIQWERGFAWYDSLFDDAGRPRRWYGESSQSYAGWEPALHRIQAYLDEPRFIVLLRHPVDRLISHYRWLWAMDLEWRPILKAVQEEAEKERDPANYRAYKLGSAYAELCPLLERYLDKKRILYLKSDNLARDPEQTLRQCFRFLEIEPIEIKTRIDANTTQSIKVWRKMGLNILLKPFPVTLRDRLDPGGRLRRRVQSILGQRKRKPPEIKDSDKAYLAELLAEDVSFYESMFRDSQERGHIRSEAAVARP
jgi:hypothetical protein